MGGGGGGYGPSRSPPPLHLCPQSTKNCQYLPPMMKIPLINFFFKSKMIIIIFFKKKKLRCENFKNFSFFS
jgi:hypothetical protein